MLPRRTANQPARADVRAPLRSPTPDRGSQVIGPRRYRTLPVAVTVVQNAALRSTLRWAARGVAHIEHCETVHEAEQMLIARSGIAIFAERRDAADREATDAFARLRMLRPYMTTVIIETGDPTGLADATEFVDAVVRTDSRRLRADVLAILGTACRAARRRAMAAELSACFAPRLQATVRLAIERGEHPQSIRELAVAAAVPRKTLDRWLATNSTLTARQLLGWGRLLAAALRLDVDGVTVADITDDLQFASPSALRNLLQRYVGLTPTQLRKAGGVRFLFAQLRDGIVSGPQPHEHAHDA